MERIINCQWHSFSRGAPKVGWERLKVSFWINEKGGKVRILSQCLWVVSYGPRDGDMGVFFYFFFIVDWNSWENAFFEVFDLRLIGGSKVYLFFFFLGGGSFFFFRVYIICRSSIMGRGGVTTGGLVGFVHFPRSFFYFIFSLLWVDWRMYMYRVIELFPTGVCGFGLFHNSTYKGFRLLGSRLGVNA